MRSPATISANTRWSVALVALDAVGFLLAFNLSYLYGIAEWLGFFSLPLLGVFVLQMSTFYVLGLYSTNEHSLRFELMARITFGVIVAGLLTAGLVYITEARDTVRLFFRGVLPGGFVMFLVWAAVIRTAVAVWAARVAKRVRWLVLTDAAPGSPLSHDLALISRSGDMSVLVDDPAKGDRLPEELKGRIVGTFDALEKDDGGQWSGIVIAAEGTLPDRVLRRIMELRLGGIRIYDLTDFCEQYMQKVPVMHLQDNWFALSHGFDLLHHETQLKIKRLLDLFLASALLIISLPVMVVVAVAIKLDRRGDAKGPVLYRQLRTGVNGGEFHMYKFRTMVNNAETDRARWAERNDRRVTRVGRVLRDSRLDELPQLWNVLKGEMSFIGPRPERPDFNKELEEQIPYYDLRHLVKPGITGWAQIMYDYGASKEDAIEKLQYDIYYIKNYSLLLDLFIVLRTLRVMLQRRGR